MALLKKEKTWILAVDRSKAKIYEWVALDKRVKEIYSLDNDEVRKPERELRADRPGHGQGFNSKVQYTMDEHVSYKMQESEAFLKKLAKHLSKNEASSNYDKLVITAADEVYQHLLKNLPAEIVSKITKHHAKNLTNMHLVDFQAYYKKHIL